MNEVVLTESGSLAHNVRLHIAASMMGVITALDQPHRVSRKSQPELMHPDTCVLWAFQ